MVKFKKVKHKKINNQLTDQQIIRCAQNILSFIRLVHPSSTESDSKEIVEIKALNRYTYREKINVETNEITPYHIKNFVYPITIYNLTKEKEIIRIKNRIMEYLNEPYCMYYSVFSFSPTTLDKNSKNAVSINKHNAVYTECLVADFDNIDKIKMKEQEDILNSLGLSEYIKIFSGNGYQLVFLLNEKCYDKNILKTFTYALLQNGLAVDSKIIDCARVMRLPYTFNNKSLKNNIHNPIFTSIKKLTNHRYNIVELMNRLGVNYHVPTQVKVKEQIPSPIESILEKGPNEHFVKYEAYALCSYYMCYTNKTYDEVKIIISSWLSIKGWTIGNYESVIYYGYHKLTRQYWNKHLTKIHGDYKFEPITNIKLHNELIRNPNISHNTWVTYLLMMIEYYKKQTYTFTFNDLKAITNLSNKTIRDSVKTLQKYNFLYIKRARNKKIGEVDKYIISTTKLESNFSAYNCTVLEYYLNMLSPYELKVFLNLKINALTSNSNTIKISQKKLAEYLNVTENRINQIIKNLYHKNFINITQRKYYGFLTQNEYDLLI